MFSQEMPSSKKKLLKRASEYFNNEKFDKALPLFLKLDTLMPDNFEIKYNIGACYLNTDFEKTKGIPYLEYALEKGGNLAPNIVFYDLGLLYHLNYQFNEADVCFQKYINNAPKNDIHLVSALRMVQVCRNAIEIISEPYQFDIFPLEHPVNTENSETTPLISADEEIIYFTRSYSKFFGNLEVEFLKKVYFSVSHNRKWSEPAEITLDPGYDINSVTLAGSSPDGDLLFFSIGDEANADLFYCKLLDGKCQNLVKFPEGINSSFWEGKISVTPDGNEIFFSSSRPGGYGGKDIYRSAKDDKGNWQKPENIGPMVNTEYDEDAPFIHPDLYTLYFSSTGHSSIGGYDVFYSNRSSPNEWSAPVNMGYPLNTTSDETGFVISANGNNAYLSSAHDNKFGKYDIYKVVLRKTIPLTLIKGTIMGGDPPVPIKAKIRVVDHETKERLRYIYNPNPKTGKYLMIFPPNKNYDMIIEAENYYPQLINIFVPDQTYFYELYQEIYLKQVRVTKNDSVIGQEITVSNTFYDIYKTQVSDSLYELNESLRKKQFDDLLKIVEDIINTTDSMGLEQLDSLSYTFIDKIPDKTEKKSRNLENLFNLIENAINTEDSVSLILLDANALYNEVTNKVYFFDAKSYSPELTPVIFGKDTIYTLTELNSTKKKSDTADYKTISEVIKTQPKQRIDYKNVPDEDKKYIYFNYIYYESGRYDIKAKYMQMLNGLAQLLMMNEELGIELHGFSDYIGNPEPNLELSKNRVFNVMEFLVSKQIDIRRIVMFSYGETKSDTNSTGIDLNMQRRVEIKVFEIANNR